MKFKHGILLFTLSALMLLVTPEAMSGQDSIGAFAIGRGGTGAQEAVNVQHELRKLIKSTGSLKQVDFQKVLSSGEKNDRQLAQAEALDILKQGKGAYDELELEKAQAKFQLAIKKFEYGYGYLENAGPMIETMMFLGATYVLAGDEAKGLEVFQRVALMPGKKTMDQDLFPPNIQEVLRKAQSQVDASEAVKLKIFTKPFGAEIYLDDVYRGGSPLTLSDIKPGIHMVRAMKDGFIPWGGKISVKPGKVNKLRLSPKPLAKRKAYSTFFGRMSAELIRKEPGPRTEKFCKFIGINKLVIAVLDGAPSSMAFRAFVVDISGEMTFGLHEKVFDINDSSYPDKLKAFLLTLIEAQGSGSQGSTGADFDEGAKSAAKLLAKSEGSEDEDEGEESFGLDLTDGSSEQESAKAQDENTAENKKPNTTDSSSEETSKTTESEDVATNKAETEKEQDEAKAQEAGKVVKETAGGKAGAEKKDSDEEFAFTWTYLHDKWWFWTGIGVLAAGAATGTYFAIAAGSDEEGGSLVLGLH